MLCRTLLSCRGGALWIPGHPPVCVGPESGFGALESQHAWFWLVPLAEGRGWELPVHPPDTSLSSCQREFPWEPTKPASEHGERCPHSVLNKLVLGLGGSGCRRVPVAPGCGLGGTSPGETRHQPGELLVWVCSFIGLFGFQFLLL